MWGLPVIKYNGEHPPNNVIVIRPSRLMSKAAQMPIIYNIKSIYVVDCDSQKGYDKVASFLMDRQKIDFYHKAKPPVSLDHIYIWYSNVVIFASSHIILRKFSKYTFASQGYYIEDIYPVSLYLADFVFKAPPDDLYLIEGCNEKQIPYWGNNKFAVGKLCL